MGTGSGSKRRGLGRGLGALIVNTEPTSPISDEIVAQASAGGVRLVSIESISPNPQQPRTHFEQTALDELAASIQEHGIIQPLIVTESTQTAGSFWLIAGERRWRAARIAEWEEVPVIIRDASPQQLVEWALVENVQRADLNPLEEAAAYHTLIEQFALTQAEVGRRVGKSRSAVANTLRLRQLPAPVQEALVADRITAGHARALLSLPDHTVIIDALERILARDLSVRQTELLVKQILEPPEEQQVPEQDVADSHLTYLEDRFRATLGTRVSLNRNIDGSGRLVVHFFGDEELDNLYQLIVGGDTL